MGDWETGHNSGIQVTKVGYRSQELDTGQKRGILEDVSQEWETGHKIGRQVTRIGYLEIGCKNGSFGYRSQE